MLITKESTTNGELRVYCTRTNSIITYFSDDGEGGSPLTAEHSDFAYPGAWADEQMEAVKHSVLEEVARRLDCTPAEVETTPFAELVSICDPDPDLLKVRIRRRTHQPTKRSFSRLR